MSSRSRALGYRWSALAKPWLDEVLLADVFKTSSSIDNARSKC